MARRRGSFNSAHGSAKRNQAAVAAGLLPTLPMGSTRCRSGTSPHASHEKAAGVFKLIPAADRSGDNLTTSYFLADCLLRTSPEVTEDALSAGQLLEASTEVVKLLETFIASSLPTSPQIPDALVKLGDALVQLKAAG